MRKKHPRSGFAMMLVLVFIVLFLGFLGVALRQTAAAQRATAEKVCVCALCRQNVTKEAFTQSRWD